MFVTTINMIMLVLNGEILGAGPRMVELEVFNDNFGDKVEPVASVETKRKWK